MNDKYDRGKNPVDVFNTVAWLRAAGKAKPFTGNHDFWRTMATINGKAASLGEAAVFRGSYEKLFDLAQDIEAVSGEDLKAVAASVFRRSNATIGALYVPAAEEEE